MSEPLAGFAAPLPPPAPAAGAPSAERQNRDLRVILDVARTMGRALELDPLLAIILDSVRDVLSAERASLFLFDPTTNELVGKIAHGAAGLRFSADRGIAGAAAAAGKTINIPDAYADPRFNRDVDQATGYRTRCLLTVPLMGLEGRLVGVVQVLNKIGGVFTEYDERLAEALAAQVGVAIQRAGLMEHYVRKKQMEGALAIARDIQQGLLPKRPPRVEGYDIAGWCRPADETGGDCFDFTPLSDGRLAITVADATGHGVGPALVISETRAYLRAMVESSAGADEVLTRANALLAADLADGRFVTAFFGVLDPKAHLLRYASAGHGPLYWYRAADRSVAATASTGLPLGLMGDLPIPAAAPVALAPGDAGIFLTDGFVESRNRDEQLFGPDRLTDLVRAHMAAPAADLIATLERAVAEFSAGGPQADDLTAVVVKRL
jgi:phosphoserine phosphatase